MCTLFLSLAKIVDTQGMNFCYHSLLFEKVYGITILHVTTHYCFTLCESVFAAKCGCGIGICQSKLRIPAMLKFVKY